MEIFEQSGEPERRVIKATVIALEKEFSEFQKDPRAALAKVRAGSVALARRLADKEGHYCRCRLNRRIAYGRYCRIVSKL